MTIRIYEASGSGKSYTAKNLSKKLNLTHVDLVIFLRENFRGVVPNQEEAIKKMNELILKNNLVIEGAYFFPMLVLKYDKIIVLKPPFYLSIIRI